MGMDEAQESGLVGWEVSWEGNCCSNKASRDLQNTSSSGSSRADSVVGCEHELKSRVKLTSARNIVCLAVLQLYFSSRVAVYHLGHQAAPVLP